MNDTEFALNGDLSPPTANGEVIFDAPWQSRAFAMARTLCDKGLYTWDEFREKLIAEIAIADAHQSEDEYQYFDHFLAALLNLLDEKGLCIQQEVVATAEEFAARPHGHDHHH